MTIQETGTFSLTGFIEEARRLDETSPPKKSPADVLKEVAAERSQMTVAIRRRIKRPAASIVVYKPKSKGFVNIPLLRLIVVPAEAPVGK